MLALECEFKYEENWETGILIEFDNQRDGNFGIIKNKDGRVFIVNIKVIKLKKTKSIFGRKCKVKINNDPERWKEYYWLGWQTCTSQIYALVEDDDGNVVTIWAESIRFIDKISDYDDIQLMNLSKMEFINKSR